MKDYRDKDIDKMGRSKDADKYAEEMLHELNEAGYGPQFRGFLEDEFDIFSPQNQAKRRKLWRKWKAKKAMKKGERRRSG